MKIVFITTVIIFFISDVSFSQITEYKIVPNDTGYNGYGWSVFSSGDYTLVGAPIFGDYGGAVYIFKRDGNDWTEKQKLIASDGVPGYFFGKTVSMSGDYLIAGAPQNDDLSGTNSSDSICAAYIFKKEVDNWSEDQKLSAGDGDKTDCFGYSVSISDQYTVIGAPRQDDTKGAAYIFKRTDTYWVEHQKLTASDGSMQDYFGVSVSISGGNILVGSSRGAYIYIIDGSNWIEYQKLIADGMDSTDVFGFSVSISSDLAIVGAPGDHNFSGAAFIFRYNGTNWIEEQKLNISDDTSHGFAGWAVSVSGDYAILGSPLDDDFGFGSGSAYIFSKGISGWSEQYKIIANDIKPINYFGWSVSLSENNAVIGAPYQDSQIRGAAYSYSNFVSGIESEEYKIPFSYSLNQNYPNPFNPTTKIRYSIPEYSDVVIKVFDILGNEIEILVNDTKPAGSYEITWYAGNLPSGVYYYRLQAGNFIETKKMILIK